MASFPWEQYLASDRIYDAFMDGPEHLIELFHGYTYSGNPIACAAALATLDTYRDEGLFDRVGDLYGLWQEALHSLRDLPHVIDIRNYGLIGAIELKAIQGKPTKRGYAAFLAAYEQGLLIRTTGDIIALSPLLIINEAQIEQMFDVLKNVLKEID